MTKEVVEHWRRRNTEGAKQDFIFITFLSLTKSPQKSGNFAHKLVIGSQLVTPIFDDGGPLGGPRLSFANGVWIDQSLSLKPSFKEIVNNVYKAASNPVDFQTKVSTADEVVDLRFLGSKKRF
ncbi:serpin-ZX-like [Olea europaea subsp. europaea]|uniref:Serpin-ZX-like n=1 Tax=Olea europaea subsp. europaea TaxID=158383 RepID=A0A8S0VA34_OLEEU|nr:serpin-ZX-like [Olea europaea subsp. europaea]